MLAAYLLVCLITPGLSDVDRIVISADKDTRPTHPANGQEACPCSAEDTVELTALQKLELELNSFEIAKVADLEEWLKDPANQKPVITLTSAQKEAIQKHNKGMFKSRADVEKTMALKIANEKGTGNNTYCSAV